MPLFVCFAVAGRLHGCHIPQIMKAQDLACVTLGWIVGGVGDGLRLIGLVGKEKSPSCSEQDGLTLCDQAMHPTLWRVILDVR